MKNRYSGAWFDLFLAAPDERQTALEVDFLLRQLPQDRYQTILDVCCGYGRHAAALAEHGYEVMAIDREPATIDAARRRDRHTGVDFQVWDMSRIRDLSRRFDAVICMWQSFGYFDGATNSDILHQAAERLNPGGRFVLDIYNREFFVERQGTRATTQHGVDVVTTQRLEGARLVVHLEYGEERGADLFDWQVFTTDSLCAEATSHGLHPLVACTAFGEHLAPDSTSPRMQFVLEKR